MRKYFVILFVALVAIKSSFGQSEQKFHFGLKAAPALAWFKSDTKEVNSDGSRLGFIYGLITEFNFGKNYAFATGLEVAYRGGKFKKSITDTSKTTNYSIIDKLEYLEIPLTLKFKTNEIGAITYYLQAGVQPGFNIRAREDYTITVQPKSGSSTSSDSTDIDIMKDINSFNMSMIVSGGLEYNLSGNTSFMGGITFSNGLLDVLDGSNAKANSNYLALTLGILF
jgi:hypothetical protein